VHQFGLSELGLETAREYGSSMTPEIIRILPEHGLVYSLLIEWPKHAVTYHGLHHERKPLAPFRDTRLHVCDTALRIQGFEGIKSLGTCVLD